VDLIVRGICSLNPGLRGISDRIRVRSIVGRFLEHSRIYYFQNGGEEEIYMGSADWMPRNLHERVEVVFPLRDALLRDRVKNEILAAYLADNVKARILQRGGSYVREDAKGKAAPFGSQDFLIDVAEGRRDASSIPVAAPPRAPRRTAKARAVKPRAAKAQAVTPHGANPHGATPQTKPHTNTHTNTHPKVT
jgi:polyphosphate kinase